MGKIVVPIDMVEVAVERIRRQHGLGHMTAEVIKTGLQASIEWLSENAPTPTGRQIQEISDSLTSKNEDHRTEDYCREWVYRMFLASEPEIPEIWMPLVRNAPADAVTMFIHGASGKVLAEIDLEAYRRRNSGS